MLRSWRQSTSVVIATLPHRLPSPLVAAAAADVVVVTVAYHSADALDALAADLARQTAVPALWLLVDNSPRSAPVRLDPLHRAAAVDSAIAATAAHDGSDLWPAFEIRLIRGQEGDGFALGCNRALEVLEAAGWDGWVWLLNPDTCLPRGDELAELERHLAALPARALVGTAVDDGKGALEASGGWIGAGLDFRGRRISEREAAAHAPVAVDWLSGCSLALRPGAHRPAARFDPLFPLYYEDMDLCLRQAAQGAAVLWLPAPRVVHRRGTGSRTPEARRWRLSTLSYLRFLKRHRTGREVVLRRLRLLLLNLLRMPLHPRRSLSVLAALGEDLLSSASSATFR